VINHPAELKIHQYLENAANGKSEMSDETIDRVASDIAAALKRQFGSGNKRKEFKLRMSNIGRPTCQLWFDKNKPEKALPKPTTFVMNMMIGDIVESVFKAVLTESNVAFKDTDTVSLSVGDIDNTYVSGSYDLIIDDAVDDIKSASDYSYRHKFDSYESLEESDPFGYISQLAGYARAAGKKLGGWWVINKASGQFKYVKAKTDVNKQMNKIIDTVNTVTLNDFKRCFSPIPETFRGKATGNYILDDNCRFCDYRFECWPTLKELPSKVSKAKVPPIVQYIEKELA
jgi:hypothetical protein